MEPVKSKIILDNKKVFPDQVELPSELILHIFSFLEVPEIANAERVCKNWQIVCLDPQIWKVLAQRFGIKEKKNGKDIFKKLHYTTEFAKEMFDRFLKTNEGSTPKSRYTFDKLKNGGFITSLLNHFNRSCPDEIHEIIESKDPKSVTKNDFNGKEFLKGTGLKGRPFLAHFLNKETIYVLFMKTLSSESSIQYESLSSRYSKIDGKSGGKSIAKFGEKEDRIFTLWVNKTTWKASRAYILSKIYGVAVFL